LNCAFSNNNASDETSGEDVYYNSNSIPYSESNTINTCSFSSLPHISGNSLTYTFNLTKCNTYYLTTTGTNDLLCITYYSACGTIDYVMRELVNKTENSVVYIDSGTYNYTIHVTHGGIDDTENHYFDRIFSIVGYISSSSLVIADNINTYPVIVSNESDQSTRLAFSFQSNVTGSFEFIKFVIGSNSGRYRFYFSTNRNPGASIIISDCVFSSEITSGKNWIYILVELGTCIVENSLLLLNIYYILLNIYYILLNI
jgi:hypothetical protein